MNILIFGASGATGHELVRQGLDQGHHVTAFVRTPSKLKVEHQNLSVIQGDAIDFPLVQNAIRDKDAVLSSLGARSPFKYDQTVVDGMQNIVKAMSEGQVARLIYLSAINVGESRQDAGLLIRFLAPILLRSETAGHEKREAIIRESSLQWTLVRAATLTNGPRLSDYRRGEDIRAGGIVASISRADVADFMLTQLTDGSYLRKAVRIMY
jgi:putative NADH-flavin reductase